MKVLVGLCTLVAIGSAAVIPWNDKPSFCKTLDCPKYSVISKTDVSNEYVYELLLLEQLTKCCNVIVERYGSFNISKDNPTRLNNSMCVNL